MTLLLIYLTGALAYWLGMAYIDGRSGEPPMTTDEFRVRIICTLIWPLPTLIMAAILAHRLGTKSRKP